MKSMETTVAGFFVFSHVKYHSKKDTKAKMRKRVSHETFDLHDHTVWHMQQRHTKVLDISLG